ncbi:MAG: DUF4124 domain-containing protein [Deltaproteobacteria bacterium]|nr:DUF4124 domain-containing protein [Deltaproteobacteria bacterium]
MPRLLALRRFAVVGAALAMPATARAWTPPGAAAAGLNTLGAPAVDFSPGSGTQPDSAVYVWVDAAGVTHFTDQTGEYLTRYRDRFQPIDLFVNAVGQPRR